ncbi:reverse transcriptase domain-containing protein [Tanacetum coccineum]
MSTHEQITNNPTSAVRNTGGRNGPQGLEEPMSDEVLREMCDKNYHQLLPLIAEKMQKEKEQKDKLNAVKARLIYGEESGIKIRSREESHYSESKTPTARTEPRRRHGGRLGIKEPATSARPDSRQRSLQAKRTEVEARRRQQKGTVSRTTSQYSESEDSEGAIKTSRSVEIHHIKQRDGEFTEDFMERYKAEVLDVEGAPECMRISGIMHGITYPGLIKRLYERIPRSMDEMYRMTTSFLQGEVAALSHGQRKASSSWKSSEGGNKPNFKKGFKNKQRPDHTGHNTNECMQLRKQIDEMIKAGKLSQFIKELKQNDKTKAPKKGEASGKDKPLTILMIQPWERVTKPRITQSFSPETAMSFPPLREEDGTEGPMIIEVEMGGHFVHRVYIDGGASSEVLYEHCFIKLRKEIRDQMVPATTHLIGFSGETIWPLGQIALLAGHKENPRPSTTAHGMLKFPVKGGTVTLQSSRVIPMECAMISGPSIQSTAENQVLEEKINIAIHPEYPEQTVAIGSTLTEKGRKELCSLLKQNLDIFAWKPAIDAKEAISAVLMTDREGRQIPVYFVSRTLRGPEVNYTPMEKLVLALLSASKRLKRYFQAHTVVVITNQPIKQLLSSSEISGRMLKWKFELEGYDIQYRPRTAIKGQILADFIVERPEEESPDELVAEPEVLPEPWTLFTDGSSCVDGSGAGLILTNPEGAEFTYAMRFRFEATNNEAEYEALIAGLRIAEQMGVKNLQANVDSRLVANQVNGSYVAKESGMCAVEKLKNKSINEKEILDVVEEEGNTWMTPIYEYLTKEILPEDKKKARAVRRKAVRNPQQNLTPITSPWPFYKWGIDIAGPFPEGPGKVKFLIVAIDYFTKWIEAKAVATITGNQVKKFVWDNIVCIFGLPGEIISDNGKQFRDNPFKIVLGEGIKARLEERSKDWLEELPHVLWAHRTMIKSSNGETPFSLTYGTEAVIPAEIGMPTLRTTEVDQANNNEALGINLDLIEERREQAAIQEAKSKKKMEKYYNSRVRGTSFKPGEMVYRSNEASHAQDGGKLGPKWEGPYEVKESLGKGAYKLKDRKGNDMPRTWNICNLKKCYIHEM